MSKARSQWTAADYRASTEKARRASRFRRAQERVRRIVDAVPPLTAEQREELARLLITGDAAPATVPPLTAEQRGASA